MKSRNLQKSAVRLRVTGFFSSVAFSASSCSGISPSMGIPQLLAITGLIVLNEYILKFHTRETFHQHELANQFLIGLLYRSPL